MKKIYFSIIIMLSLSIGSFLNAYAEESSYAIIKFVEKQELQNSDLAIVEFFIINNSNEPVDITHDVFLSDSENRKYHYSKNQDIVNSNNCMPTALTVNPQFSTSIRLCFEIPKNNENYQLNLSTAKLQDSIPLYLSSHKLTDGFQIQDFKKIFVTIHDIDIIKTNIGDVVKVKLSIYNGYFSEGKTGKSNIVISLTGKNIFVEDSNQNFGEVIWDQHLQTLEKICPKSSPVDSETFKTVEICFKRPKSGNGSYDSNLYLTMNESTYIYACSGCQEKSWDLTSYFEKHRFILESKVSEEGKKIPDWVKNTMKWYLDGSISENEMISAIEFLIKAKIIAIH